MAVLDFYRSAVSHFLNGKLALDSPVNWLEKKTLAALTSNDT
jgi:hypothetical protein